MAVTPRTLKPTPNHELLNLIRSKGSPDYERRIPEATKATVSSTLEALTDPSNRNLWNEFVDALVNRIGLVVSQSKSFTNPLAEFKLGVLPYGSTIEEYQVGLIDAMSYDADREHLEKDIFGRASIEVQSSFHTVNRRDTYKVSVNTQQLKAAFLEEFGLTNFVNDLMNAPANSDQWDEFLLMANLFAEYEKNGGFFRINVPNVSALNSTAEDAKTALRTLRTVEDMLRFPSRLYNAAGMPTWVNPEELVIFTTPEFKSGIDVNALAEVFNISKAEVRSRIITLKREHFGIADCEAIITSKKFFMVADTHFEMASAWNPRDLLNNYFLHHWQIISASRFVPAIMLTTGPGTEVGMAPTPVTGVSGITVTNRTGEEQTTIPRGNIYELAATVTTDPADGLNDAVIWSVSGAESSRTFVTQDGVLSVGSDESSESITLTATAQWINPEDPRATAEEATRTYALTGDPVQLWPVPKEVEPDPEPVTDPEA